MPWHLEHHRRLLLNQRFVDQAHAQVQLMGLDHLVGRQQHCLLQHVAQLPHVAWPAVAQHQGLGLGGKTQVRLAITAAMVRQEMPSQ
ncbi:hypothetical protein D3C77_713460 [compost metagenome]